MYVCEIRNDCCCNDEQNVQNLTPVEKFTPPRMSIEHQGNYWDFRDEFYFSRKSSEPKLSKNTYKELKSISNYLKKSNQKIQITGLFLQDEFKQHELGFARADEVKKILMKFGAPKNSIELASRENSTPIIPEGTEDIYNAIEFDFIAPNLIYFKSLQAGKEVRFDAASDDLIETEEMRAFIYMACEYVQQHPKTIISCIGHTDNRGDKIANQKLSEDRAKDVAEYLIEYGVPAKNVEAIGVGEILPLHDNDTENGRKFNRRVEIKLIKNN